MCADGLQLAFTVPVQSMCRWPRALAVVTVVCTLLLGFVESRLPVIWSAPFFSGGGYCSEAIEFVRALDAAGVQVRITQHGDAVDHVFVRGLAPDVARQLARLGRAAVDPARAVTVCHSEPGAWHPAMFHTSRCPSKASALYTIGRTMFETDRLPDGWRARLNSMDEVWVPTAFHHRIFVDGGVNPQKVHIIGEGVDVDFFDPVRARADAMRFPFALPGASDGEFAFLSVFKFEERKGWRTLVEAFAREFDPERDACALYILTASYHSQADFADAIDAHLASAGDVPAARRRPRIRLVPRGVPAQAMPALYASVDAFVLASKGEGWGRPHAEAMSMALPVIATNWSGTLEFMNERNAYPLPIVGLDEIVDGPFRGHRWATPDRAALQHLMRHVQTHPDEARAKGVQARRDMAERWCLECVARVVDERLARIEERLRADERHDEL